MKVPVTLFDILLEDHIVSQMISVDGDITGKVEYHIGRSHYIGKHLERRYQCVSDITQSQTSQSRLQDLFSNLIVETKSE